MSKPKRRKQFTFYASYYDAIQDLPASRRYETLDAMIVYALDGTLPTGLKGPARGVFRAIQPNLDSARIKAETAQRKSPQEGPFSELWEEPEREPGPERADEQGGGNETETENEIENEIENKTESEREKEKEKEKEDEKEKETEKKRGAGPRGDGGRGGPAAAGDGSGLSLPEKELKKILLKTPLIGRPPYDAMFRQDPLLIYFWKDAAEAGPGGGPLPEPEQRGLLTELLSLPTWERPAHLNDRFYPRAGGG